MIFVDEPSVNDINIFEIFTESIIQASESEIPKILKSSHKCPWTSDEFLSLLEKRKSCNDPSIRRELGISINPIPGGGASPPPPPRVFFLRLLFNR